MNSVFEDLGQTVSDEQGLKHLTIEYFEDQNELQEWPLGQLVLKAHHLQSLKLAHLNLTTADNRSLLLEFAAKAATFSSCMRTLHIEGTKSSEADGDKFMEALAEKAEFDSLQSLTIAEEWKWFEDGRDGCMDALVTIIAKQ